MRREKKAIRTVKEMNIKGRKRRGRLKNWWLNAIESDMMTGGFCVEDVGDRVK